MGWTAVHLPCDVDTRCGFESENAAWEYVERWICHDCKASGLGLDGPCAAEWLVVEDEKYSDAETVGELFEAAGFIPGG